jgi:DNA processing protein
MEEKLYQIALTLIPKVGPVTARNLISYCGSPQAVFESTKKALLKIPGIGPQLCDNILNKEVFKKAEQELVYIQQYDIQPLFYLDKQYPKRLQHLPDSPVLLYYKGTASLNATRNVAIVGTRKPSAHGVRICEELVEGLSKYNIHLISGLAYGIDITAHRHCLSLGMPTIGVLGHGLKEIYPPQHKNTAQEMIKHGGLLSEYPSYMRPDREHFPMRNRIVAGLCDALIVVETRRKGGSMITASMANDYNKDVFAVPGRLKDKSSEGCNWLIKAHRAALIERAEDVAYIMRWEALDNEKSVQHQLFIEYTEDEKIVVDLLKQQESASIDELTSKTKLASSKMAGLLLELEFKGAIRTLPGKRFVLV